MASFQHIIKKLLMRFLLFCSKSLKPLHFSLLQHIWIQSSFISIAQVASCFSFGQHISVGRPT